MEHNAAPAPLPCRDCGEPFEKELKRQGRRCLPCYREACRERARRYYEENLEKERERARRYYEENLEKERERSHRYREENREKRLEYARRYREENREKERSRHRRYDEENREARREKYIAHWHTRRARKLAAFVEHVSREAVGDRDGWTCGLCGDPVDRALAYPDPLSPSLDHVIPLARGGEHSYANTQIAHLRCNVAKGAREDS